MDVPGTHRTRVTGAVLAAGAGRRMGIPKALVTDDGGRSWLRRTVEAVRAGGCEDVVVVLGAEPDRVRASYDGPPVDLVVASDWDSGMGASLRAALTSYTGDPSPPHALLIMLVDLPDVGAEVIRRVVDHADGAPDRTAVLARATYDGRPGHPVLVGRDHWAGMAATLAGDEGGRRYLAEHDTVAIECGDLATGRDQDTPLGEPE